MSADKPAKTGERLDADQLTRFVRWTDVAADFELARFVREHAIDLVIALGEAKELGLVRALAKAAGLDLKALGDAARDELAARADAKAGTVS